MFFLSGIYRTIKLAIAGLGGISAIGALVAGIVMGGTTGTILIVGGSLWVANSAFHFFDTAVPFSILKKDLDNLRDQLKKFSDENIKLHGNVAELEKIKIDFIKENEKLIHSLEKSEVQLGKLDKLKQKYEETNGKYQQLIETEKKEIVKLEKQNIIYIKENDKLVETLSELKILQDEINDENNRLNIAILDNQEQIKQLGRVKDDYVEENHKLQKTNHDSAEQLTVLKDQVFKLKEMYKSSTLLLKNFYDAAATFNQFGETISNNITEIKDTAEELDETKTDLGHELNKLKNLVENLETKTFEELDKNQDGVITKEEFDNAIDDRKN